MEEKDKARISDLIRHLEDYLEEHGDKFIFWHQRDKNGWYLEKIDLDEFVTYDEYDDCVNIDH